MTITVNPETERMIAEQIELGHFVTPEDVISTAVLELTMADFDHTLDEEDIAAINEAEAEIDRGEGIDLAAFDAAMDRLKGKP